jgi:ABC-type iron transport system FetAB permease component
MLAMEQYELRVKMKDGVQIPSYISSPIIFPNTIPPNTIPPNTILHVMKSRLWMLLLATATLVLTLPLIFFGLDFTDAGYSTTIAWTHAVMPSAADWSINTFGTPTLAGLWFKVAEAVGWHSLLGFRVCWVLTMLVAVLAAYWSLTQFYEPRHVAFALVPTLVLAVFNSEEVIVPEYHNFPPVLCLMAAALFLRSFDNASLERWKIFGLSRSTLQLFFAGVMAALTVLARLPMLAFAAFMLAGLITSAFWGKEKNGTNPSPGTIALQRSAWLVAGMSVGAVLAVVLLLANGFTLAWIWNETVDSQHANTEFMRTVNPALGYMPLWKSTLLRYAKILGMGALLVAGSAAWKRLRGVFPQTLTSTKILRLVELAAIIGFAALIVKIVRNGAAGFLGFHYGPITSILLGAPLLVVLGIAVFEWRELPLAKRMLIATSVAFFVIASLGGSGVWVSTFRHGVWLVLPVMLLESRAAIARGSKQSMLARHLDMALLRRLMTAGVFALGFMLRVEMPYRDKPVYELTAGIDHPALRGIRTSAGRAENLQEALQAASRLDVQKGDTLQCYPDGALLYFLTETTPWYPDTWIGMQWTSRQDIALLASRMIYKPKTAPRSTFPHYVIRLKFDPNSAPSLDADKPAPRFTLGSDSLYYGFLNQPAARYLDSLWLLHGYKTLWENKGFAILKRPD